MHIFQYVHISQNQDIIYQESITRKAMWFKIDSIKIIQYKSKNNLCMFYSILNGVPTYDQKLAFTRNCTGSDPSTNFLRFNMGNSTRDHKTLGITASEMIDWRKNLKRNLIN